MAIMVAATVPASQVRGPARGASKSAVSEERVVYRAPAYELRWDGEFLQVHSRPMAGEGREDLIVMCDLRCMTQDQGYVSERKIVSMSIETSRPPPRASSAEPRIRMRLEIEKKARLEIDLRCGTNSIAMDFDFKPPPSGEAMLWQGAVRLPRLAVADKADPSAPPRPPPPEMCRGMVLDMVERGGRAFSLGYGEAAGEPPDVIAWALRGVWPGWVVRAQAGGREDIFRYWQLYGRRPVEGCGLVFAAEQRAAQRRFTLWIEREGSAAPPAPAKPR